MEENANHLKPVQPRSLSHSSVNADLELFQLCFQTELKSWTLYSFRAMLSPNRASRQFQLTF